MAVLTGSTQNKCDRTQPYGIFPHEYAEAPHALGSFCIVFLRDRPDWNGSEQRHTDDHNPCAPPAGGPWPAIFSVPKCHWWESSLYVVARIGRSAFRSSAFSHWRDHRHTRVNWSVD